jgi:hypothetical protein
MKRRHVRRGVKPLTTTEQGYGHLHKQERERWRPVVEAGNARCAELICLLPTRTINPGAPWDLAHNRQTGAYRGPAHRRCNRAEGARHKEALRQGRATITRPDQPAAREWHSREW